MTTMFMVILSLWSVHSEDQVALPFRDGSRHDPSLHPVWSGMTMNINNSVRPREVFPTWRRAQVEVDLLAREARVAPSALRTTGFLSADLAQRVTAWFTGAPTATAEPVRASYRALERDTAWLFGVICRAWPSGGLGVRVHYTHQEGEPYRDAAALCAELRHDRMMTLATIARDEPHPLLGGEEGGVVDQLRVVHDVFGHAAVRPPVRVRHVVAVPGAVLAPGTRRRVLRAGGRGDGVRGHR
jgi:hypothetical protein